MKRPSIHDKCISCAHFFGEHFISFNEKITGCGVSLVTKQRSPTDYDTNLCTCLGFAVVYKPETTPVETKEYEDDIVRALDNDPERFGSWGGAR
jgi:hypothetical protein